MITTRTQFWKISE